MALQQTESTVSNGCGHVAAANSTLHALPDTDAPCMFWRDPDEHVTMNSMAGWLMRSYHGSQLDLVWSVRSRGRATPWNHLPCVYMAATALREQPTRLLRAWQDNGAGGLPKPPEGPETARPSQHQIPQCTSILLHARQPLECPFQEERKALSLSRRGHWGP